MSDIFLSYRRQDSSSATGRLADRLEQHFGPRRVFRDYDSIVAGEDFAEAIHRAISVSTVVLAVVGPDWLDVRDSQGRRRLDNPADFVRIEIESALDAAVPVIPVLVEGARMPAAADLPGSLRAFARCQAVELSEPRWREDTDRLIASLQAQFAIESDAPPLAKGGGGSAFDVFARFALDMLELATQPKRLIARRQTGHALDHVRAFLFLLACLLLGNLALTVGLDLTKPLSWIAVGVLFSLILVTLLSLPLTVAWRLCGARTRFKQVTLIFAYLYGGGWIGFCGGALLLLMSMQAADAQVFTNYLAIFQLPKPFFEQLVFAQSLFQITTRGLVMSPAVLAGLEWLVTLAWMILAWDAFRVTYNLSRWRSIAALLIWLGQVVIAVWFVGAAGANG